MDTKTDTKHSLRICLANFAFGVHLGVHLSLKTGSATLYHRARSAGLWKEQMFGTARSSCVGKSYGLLTSEDDVHRAVAVVSWGWSNGIRALLSPRVPNNFIVDQVPHQLRVAKHVAEPPDTQMEGPAQQGSRARERRSNRCRRQNADS